MKNLRLLCLLVLVILVGCGNVSNKPINEKKPKLVYVMVSKDINNPYMKKAFDGFEKACKEIGAIAVFKGPQIATAEGQIEIVKQLIIEKVDLIAIAANDADALDEVLQEALDVGIKVISYDSAVNPESRLTHVQQADPEQIGRVLIQAAYEMTNGKGGIGILSSTAVATNQNLWIKWMQTEIKENPDKYKNMPLLQIVYGDDEPLRSTEAVKELLRNSKIKVIIAPTAVGMLAAGQYLGENKSDVLLTGLGLPSEIAIFIEQGVCPWMYLWNPLDLGYLTAYTGNALVNGEITGRSGDAFFAGSMGERVIMLAGDGGSEVMLGDPFKFDKANIAGWKEVY